MNATMKQNARTAADCTDITVKTCSAYRCGGRYGAVPRKVRQNCVRTTDILMFVVRASKINRRGETRTIIYT